MITLLFFQVLPYISSTDLELLSNLFRGELRVVLQNKLLLLAGKCLSLTYPPLNHLRLTLFIGYLPVKPGF